MSMWVYSCYHVNILRETDRKTLTKYAKQLHVAMYALHALAGCRNMGSIPMRGASEIVEIKLGSQPNVATPTAKQQ